MTLSILRILLYIQLLLGLVKYAGAGLGITLGRVFDIHTLLGVVIAILAIVALGHVPNVRQTGIRVAARFFPILPLALGFGFLVHLVTGAAFVVLHMILGIVTIGLVEAASAQQRRAQRRRRSFAG